MFEAHDNFTKQTYRNRMYIANSNGKQLLNIPVKHTQNNRQLYKNITVSNAENWQQHHYKSLCSAYNKSPFFEFYIDDLKPLFFEPVEHLFEFNLNCFKTICECLQLDIDFKFTTHFNTHTHTDNDFRYLVEPSKKFTFSSYNQVFSSKYNFLPNLSILDLLFNKGPSSVLYLEQQTVTLN